MTKEDYVAWRDHPITKEVMQATVEEMNNVIEDLLQTVGESSLMDKYRKGFIDGLKWWISDYVASIEESDITVETDEDADSEGSQDSY